MAVSYGKQPVPATREIVDLPPIELVATIELAGRVIDQLDHPVVGKTVKSSVGDRTYGTGETEANGRFTILASPDKGFRYQVRSDGGNFVDAEIVEQDPLVLRIRVVK